jgi:hypothetical protein
VLADVASFWLVAFCESRNPGRLNACPTFYASAWRM